MWMNRDEDVVPCLTSDDHHDVIRNVSVFSAAGFDVYIVVEVRGEV